MILEAITHARLSCGDPPAVGALLSAQNRRRNRKDSEPKSQQDCHCPVPFPEVHAAVLLKANCQCSAAPAGTGANLASKMGCRAATRICSVRSVHAKSSSGCCSLALPFSEQGKLRTF